MKAKFSGFVISVKAVIYLLLYNLQDCTFKFNAFAARKFFEWSQAGINVYTPHRKYQVKSYSSPWFSAACASAIIVHRNHFIHL